MDEGLKLYVINALVIGEDGRDRDDENGIYFGEPPYEDFYIKAIGRAVDVDEEGEDEIEGVKEYLLNYPVTAQQLESITFLGFDTGNSAYETFVYPCWHGEDGATDVKSLEAIDQMPNLETLVMFQVDKNCSLEPLKKLTKLKEIVQLNSMLQDYSPLLDIPSLEKLSVSGSMPQKIYNEYIKVIEQLRTRGVKVLDKVTAYSSGFGGLF